MLTLQIKRTLLAASLWIGGVAIAQSIVVNPSPIEGVDFIGASDPGFSSAVMAVVGPTPPSAERDWLPLSAILTNRTSGPILAVVARWVKVMPDGTDTAMVVERNFFGSPVRRIDGGASAVVLPGWVFLKPLPTGSRDATDTPDHAASVQSFKRATRVELSLDAVVFASGQCVGPDETKECEGLIARRKARQVFNETVSRYNNGQSALQIVDWLTSIANQKQPHVRTSDIYVNQSIQFAKMLLTTNKQQGITLMYRQAAANALPPNDVRVFR